VQEGQHVADEGRDVVAARGRQLPVEARQELDGGLLALAKSIVRTNLTRPDLSPEFVAGQMGVSRATLYRGW
jgi:hypothetical protein